VYSKPTTQKVRNLHASPKVAIHLRDVDDGSDIVSIEGTAEIDESYPSAAAIPEYLTKYRSMIADLNMDPESFAKSYSIPVRIRPTKIRVE
jgi:PPOX class probable F420-dependent enzyme